jgi:hypothetical protein
LPKERTNEDLRWNRQNPASVSLTKSEDKAAVKKEALRRFFKKPSASERFSSLPKSKGSAVGSSLDTGNET